MNNELIKKSRWIIAKDTSIECPLFKKDFALKGEVDSCILQISVKGVFAAEINGKRISESVLMPGFTQYNKRLLYCTYDITDLLKHNNTLIVETAKGWYSGRIAKRTIGEPVQLIAAIDINYKNGESEQIFTDYTWQFSKGPMSFCDIYDGVIYDANATPDFSDVCDLSEFAELHTLTEHDGADIKEQERIEPIAIFKTPKGETVLDFGQNLVGTLETRVNAQKGDKIEISFAEILDKDGNFYNENYRSAKCLYDYTAKEGEQVFKPIHTFFGFRYIRVDKFPEAPKAENFTAVVIHSEMKRTGYIESSNPMINQLFSNIIWGQKGNYLDIPTDCPQRDERMGWTGDTQVFCKTASYNFDVSLFFKKWMRDVFAAQGTSGYVPDTIPWPIRWGLDGHCGWGDAVSICPWQMYMTYGDEGFLKEAFPAIKNWIKYIESITAEKYLWSGCWQYGDWLELAAPYGEFKGETRDDICASAFFANTVSIAIRIGEMLGEDIEYYKSLYRNIIKKYEETYLPSLNTQTEFVLTLYFGLCEDKKETAKALYDKVIADGKKIQTGFLGTPYILHVLSENGYSDLAYDLLLREEYPSWLYPITKGATTIWEHWDGIMPNGDIWPAKMNSYNHYAYGCVADWMYEVAAGIKPTSPGFKEILFAPVSTDKIDSFGAKIETKEGLVSSRWWHEGKKVCYEIITPSPAIAIINGKEYRLTPGKYNF